MISSIGFEIRNAAIKEGLANVHKGASSIAVEATCEGDENLPPHSRPNSDTLTRLINKRRMDSRPAEPKRDELDFEV